MLLNTYVQVYGQLPQFFESLRAGTAPEKFTRQYLKDLGFKSSNHHALIPLLKGLGFLTADGSPTTLYREFLDKSKWKKVLGAALKDKYSDIFTLKSNPSKADKSIIEGKFKSTYNTSDNVAALNANTFLALLELGDLSGSVAEIELAPVIASENSTSANTLQSNLNLQGLYYNIQIHLPPTKDIEVYNAIFKSLRDHLVGP
jgi:hypothetical protein